MKFRAYHEQRRAPWAIGLIGMGLRRYVRNYMDEQKFIDLPATHLLLVDEVEGLQPAET